MKTKLWDTVAFAGTGVVNRKGSDSAFVLVKGTGVKIQHCDTDNGEFADYETLGDFDKTTGKFVNLEGAKDYIQIVADFGAIIFGDLKVEPSQIETVGDVVSNLYAYTYEDSGDDFLIYTDHPVTEEGDIVIYTPEVGTTYGYNLTKGTLTIADVDEDGKITDDSDVVYTPVADEDISLY